MLLRRGPSADEAIARHARQFEGAWAYLELIAAAAGIGDPLDPRVVEAYWVGNDLLDLISGVDVARQLQDRLPPQPGASWFAGAAHHGYQVFSVYPWVGLLAKRRGNPAAALDILQQCRIRWGEVVGIARRPGRGPLGAAGTRRGPARTRRTLPGHRSALGGRAGADRRHGRDALGLGVRRARAREGDHAARAHAGAARQRERCAVCLGAACSTCRSRRRAGPACCGCSPTSARFPATPSTSRRSQRCLPRWPSTTSRSGFVTTASYAASSTTTGNARCTHRAGCGSPWSAIRPGACGRVAIEDIAARTGVLRLPSGSSLVSAPAVPLPFHPVIFDRPTADTVGSLYAADFDEFGYEPPAPLTGTQPDSA